MSFNLAKPWPEDLRPVIAEKVQASGTKIVVLDDDPTGRPRSYISQQWLV